MTFGWSPSGYCIPRLVQYIGEKEVNRGNHARWMTNMVVHHPIGELSLQWHPATVASTKELTRRFSNCGVITLQGGVRAY
ncbi:hypothetical protein TNCV_4442151 [Trichonephila clavipes]|nr:hypothetical protein TNCV_4442151 [Trichonephila clavipes]